MAMAVSTSLLKNIRLRPIQTIRIWSYTSSRESSKYFQTVDPLPIKYGGKTNIIVLPGVGIGPEIMHSTLEVLKAAEAPLSYEIMTIRPDHEDEDFSHIVTAVKRNKVVLKGNIETKSKDPLIQSRNIILRKLLDLYAYILPLKSYPGIRTKFGPMDLVVVRLNTEGEYLMLEHEPNKGSVESLKVITRYNTRRLAEYAYNYALTKKRKHVTLVHTADVHPLTEGLFVESVLKVAEKYPQMETRVKEVRIAAIELLTSPNDYDVIISTNLNGGMISNFLNGMLGGPALSAGTNLGENGIAVFEPGVRNKGSGIVNRGIANPTAMLMAASNLLQYLGHEKTSEIINNAIYRSMVYDGLLTQELGGKATTQQVTDNIIRHVRLLMGPSQRMRTPSKVKHKRCEVPPRDGGACTCPPS